MRYGHFLMAGAVIVVIAAITANLWDRGPAWERGGAPQAQVVLLQQQAYLCGALDMGTYAIAKEVTPGECAKVRKIILDNWTDRTNIPAFLTAPVKAE